MDVEPGSARFLAALRDFHRARMRGTLESVIARLSGRSGRLLSYEEVSQQLKPGEIVDRGLQQIPLDAIVGSVGRYGDFTRSFLPRHESAEERWARVRATISDVGDISPINVYQVGNSYFVLDGNHRVSVARVLGANHIPAYVTEVEIKVPLSPDVQPDELIIQAKQANFLEETRLDETRPEADLQVTAPGQYRVLWEEIQQHRQWLRRHGNSAVTLAEAAANWYDEVYLPIVAVIRRRGILRYFPDRTETDLYVWIVRHREELAQELGWDVKPEAAASDLAQRFSPGPQQVLARVKEQVLAAITPDSLEAGPPAGRWREVEVATRIEPTLFADILVPIRGDETGWRALQQALVVARRENGRLHGLHMLAGDEEGAQERGAALQVAFQEQIEEAGATGELSLESGRVARTICSRAQYNDLVVLALTYLPGAQPVSRLSSGFGTLVRRCGRPVLAVPAKPSPLERPLLAYDGSPKAKEALFVAAYLAAKWELPLVVATVDEAERAAAATLEDARLYLLARGVSADYVAVAGVVSEVLQETADTHGCDLIVMGGYGFRPLLEVVLGSTVDQVLSWRRWPVLICR